MKASRSVWARGTAAKGRVSATTPRPPGRIRPCARSGIGTRDLIGHSATADTIRRGGRRRSSSVAQFRSARAALRLEDLVSWNSRGSDAWKRCHTIKNQPMHASSSEAVTNNVRVEVESQYAPDHSQPFQSHWFFHYTVKITNEGDDTVQLLSRHWFITDANGPYGGGERHRRGRRTAGARAGRVVRLHVGLSAEDLERRHAGHLLDGHRRRRPLRRGDCPVRPSGALHGSLRRTVGRVRLRPDTTSVNLQSAVSQSGFAYSRIASRKASPKSAAFFTPTP